jgi:hypothetical protein
MMRCRQRSNTFPERAAVAALGLALAACAAAPVLQPDPVHSAAGLRDADSLRAVTIAPGVTHVYAWHGAGPWAIHIIEVDRTSCEPLLEARKPEGPLSARATTSELATGAIVTINADFFMLPGGTPVGAHVRDGVPFIGPTDRHIFGVSAEGRWVGGVARLRGHAVSRGDSVRLAQINRPAMPFSAYAGTRDGVTLFSSRVDSVPADSAARRVLMRLLQGDERAGSGVVTSADSPATAIAISGATTALLAHGTARGWARRRAAGDTVIWEARVVLPARGDQPETHVVEAVGGFPELLRDGRDVLGQQIVWPPFGEQRHPRTAVGWSGDGRRHFLVVVDGRRPPYSDGMSLPELTWLFRRIGATDAINLDGGGSTALLIGDRLVNRPTDAEGERPVGNALALARCRP